MSTEAMKLALEALEETYAMSHRVEGMKNRAMIALREALAQTQQELVQSKPDKNYISADNYGLSYEDTGVGFTDGDPNDGY